MVTVPLVLAVDDEESDAFLLRCAFEHAAISNPLLALQDGQELVDYLQHRNPYNDPNQFPLPGLVLLDLKMPRMDGFEVLDWIHVREEFRHIPFVVFSASGCDADIKKALRLGASDFLSKPSQFTGLVQLVKALHRRWLGANASPVQKNPSKRQVFVGPFRQ
jgi:CheY-like chemotaxis protein